MSPYSAAAMQDCPSRADSFESLLSLNMLASSLLEDNVELETLSLHNGSGNLGHFATDLPTSRRSSFLNRASHESIPHHSLNSNDTPFTNLRFLPPLDTPETERDRHFKHAHPRAHAHARNPSNATQGSSAADSLPDSASFLSRSGTHSTRNTSYGSHSAFVAKPGGEAGGASFLPPPPSARVFIRQDVEEAEDVGDREPGMPGVVDDGAVTPQQEMGGMVLPPSTPSTPARSFRPSLANPVTPMSSDTKISDWLREQYDSGVRSPSRATPSRASSMAWIKADTPVEGSRHSETPCTDSSPTSPSLVHPSEPSPSRPRFASKEVRKTSSREFRHNLLHEIIEGDFARPAPASGTSTGTGTEYVRPEHVQRACSRELLWHPSEHVGPLRRSNTSAVPRRGSHVRTYSAELLSSRTQDQRDGAGAGWTANPAGRASMNDLLLRPAEDPRRAEAEYSYETRRRGFSLGKFSLRSKNRTVRRSPSKSLLSGTLSSLFGSSRPGSPLRKNPPPGLSSDGIAVVYNHTRSSSAGTSSSFVVHPSPSPTRPRGAMGRHTPTAAAACDTSASGPPFPITSSSRTSSREPPSPGGRSLAESVSSSAHRRSVRRFQNLYRKKSGRRSATPPALGRDATTISVELKARQAHESDRLAELAHQQVVRDAEARAMAVHRFVPANGNKSSLSIHSVNTITD